MPKLQSFVVLVALTLSAGAASAQDASAQETVELSKTQRAYNAKGVEAADAGEWDAAVRHFRASLNIGEANVTWLNLGRTYQRRGWCKEAKEAYGAVPKAPAVPVPSRTELLKVREKFLAELPEVCPVQLTVSCSEPSAVVSVDGGEQLACDDATQLELEPGEHTVVARLGERTTEETFDAEAGDRPEISLSFPAEEETEPVATPVQPPPTDEPSGGALSTVGIVLAGAGVATVVTGIVLDATLVRAAVEPCTDQPDENCDIEAAKEWKTRNAVILGTGAGLTILGGVLYLVGRPAEGVSFRWRDGPGVAWTVHW